MGTLRLALGAVVLGLLAPGAVGQGFVEVGTARGIQPRTHGFGMGIGLSAADIEDDGDIDFFVATDVDHLNQVYINDGTGNFTESSVALQVLAPVRTRLGLWVDYDGDRDLDLLMSDDGFFPLEPTQNWLYQQQADGTFVDVTVSAGLFFADSIVHRGGMCAADINNDHYLDLYLTNWNGRDYLLLNNTNCAFVDITESSGVAQPFLRQSQFQPMAADFNRDGWMDFYVAVDFYENLLWINQGDNTFQDIAIQAHADPLFNDMGMTICDYDHDGDLDVFTSNIAVLDKHNVLLRNDTLGATVDFTETSQQAGVDLAEWGWGTTFFEINNDGHPDLAVTNGYRPGEWFPDQSQLFEHDGQDPVQFIEVSQAYGFDDLEWGSALAAADFDRDGDQELLQACYDGPIRLLDNQLTSAPGSNPQAHSLLIKPRMETANHRAIGAEVRIFVQGLQTTRLISAGTSAFSQEPAEAFFGMGSAASAESVRVHFPDGRTADLENVPANQVLMVTPPPITDLQVMQGRVIDGDSLALRRKDGEILTVGSDTGKALLEVGMQTRAGREGSLRILVNASANQRGVRGILQLYNWTTSKYDEIGRQSMPRQVRPWLADGLNAADYISPRGRLQLRIDQEVEAISMRSGMPDLRVQLEQVRFRVE